MSGKLRPAAFDLPEDWDPQLCAKILAMRSDAAAGPLHFPARPASTRSKADSATAETVPGPHDLRQRTGLRTVQKRRRQRSANTTYATTVLAAALFGGIIGFVASTDLTQILPTEVATAPQAAKTQTLAPTTLAQRAPATHLGTIQ